LATFLHRDSIAYYTLSAACQKNRQRINTENKIACVLSERKYVVYSKLNERFIEMESVLPQQI